MNRKHSKEEYLDTVKAKKINPKIKFSSDFIIGYRVKRENDFIDTLKLIEKMEYINIYSYVFSPRPGTPAANMKQVNREVAKQRLKVFQEKAAKIKMCYRENLFNKQSLVLFENKIENSDKYFGRDEYLNSVVVKSNEDLKGKIFEVKNIKWKSKYFSWNDKKKNKRNSTV